MKQPAIACAVLAASCGTAVAGTVDILQGRGQVSIRMAFHPISPEHPSIPNHYPVSRVRVFCRTPDWPWWVPRRKFAPLKAPETPALVLDVGHRSPGSTSWWR